MSCDFVIGPAAIVDASPFRRFVLSDEPTQCSSERSAKQWKSRAFGAENSTFLVRRDGPRAGIILPCPFSSATAHHSLLRCRSGETPRIQHAERRDGLQRIREVTGIRSRLITTSARARYSSPPVPRARGRCRTERPDTCRAAGTRGERRWRKIGRASCRERV